MPSHYQQRLLQESNVRDGKYGVMSFHWEPTARIKTWRLANRAIIIPYCSREVFRMTKIFVRVMRLLVWNRDPKVKIVCRAHYNNMYQSRKLINQSIKIVVLLFYLTFLELDFRVICTIVDMLSKHCSHIRLGRLTWARGGCDSRNYPWCAHLYALW